MNSLLSKKRKIETRSIKEGDFGQLCKELPFEIWNEIIDYVITKETIGTLMFVCKQFREICLEKDKTLNFRHLTIDVATLDFSRLGDKEFSCQTPVLVLRNKPPRISSSFFPFQAIRSLSVFNTVLTRLYKGTSDKIKTLVLCPFRLDNRDDLINNFGHGKLENCVIMAQQPFAGNIIESLGEKCENSIPPATHWRRLFLSIPFEIKNRIGTFTHLLKLDDLSSVKHLYIATRSLSNLHFKKCIEKAALDKRTKSILFYFSGSSETWWYENRHLQNELESIATQDLILGIQVQHDMESYKDQSGFRVPDISVFYPTNFGALYLNNVYIPWATLAAFFHYSTETLCYLNLADVHVNVPMDDQQTLPPEKFSGTFQKLIKITVTNLWFARYSPRNFESAAHIPIYSPGICEFDIKDKSLTFVVLE